MVKIITILYQYRLFQPNQKDKNENIKPNFCREIPIIKNEYENNSFIFYDLLPDNSRQ